MTRSAESRKPIRRALVSVYHKEGLEKLLRQLGQSGVEILSTGGTYDYVTSLDLPCTKVEDRTGLPSILGGRVKTLHPVVFGGILTRRGNEQDDKDCRRFDIDPIDLVIVDLYPFEDTVASGASHEDIIEKIDIGGISLIRAAAKNYSDVVIIPSANYYDELTALLAEQDGETTLEQRRHFARAAFEVSSSYDTAIHDYFLSLDGPAEESDDLLPQDCFALLMEGCQSMRYGENPHQRAAYYGRGFEERFDYLHGKQISYNNLLDVDAAVHMIEEMDEPACGIVKHNTPCGLAVRETIRDAYLAALSCDTESAFGGIVVLNRPVDMETAEELHKLFIEVLIAPNYSKEALELLTQKKNRIILRDKIGRDRYPLQFRSALAGVLVQERDTLVDQAKDLTVVTRTTPSETETSDLLFAMQAVKYCKSNAIVLAKDRQILGAGYGQTSRVEALRQAISKAAAMGFSLEGSVMASDAFFPFPDCVEIAHEAGVVSVIQPGGSIRDQESISYCDEHGMSIVTTGHRHFRH